MNILVIGKSGQLAHSLGQRAKDPLFQTPGSKLAFLGRPDIDLEQPESLHAPIKALKPSLIINAAAWTAVDDAEDQIGQATAVNTEAPKVLAQLCRELGSKLIHISTDYVYDGSKADPYVETDPTNPQSIYGRTKRDGEQFVRDTCEDHLILRTAWVFSPFGKNFVKTMLRLAETRDTLNIVDDQHGNPTSALDLAEACLRIAQKWQAGETLGLGQTLHCAGTGQTNWAEFARHIFKLSQQQGGSFAKVEGIPSSAFPTKATRPRNSRLDTSAFNRTFGWQMPDWQTSLDHCMKQLHQQSA